MGEGRVNDRSSLEGEAAAAAVAVKRKSSGTIKRGGIKMSREAAGTAGGDGEEGREL